MPLGTFKCPIHIANDLQIFCIICQQILCNDCTILLHRGHKCVAIAKAANAYTKLLNENVAKMKPVVGAVIRTKHHINNNSKKLHQRCEQVAKDVEEFFVEYFAALERHKSRLLAQISQLRQTKMATVLAAQIEIDRWSEQMEQTIKFTEEVLDNGSDLEKLSLVGVLRKRFDLCGKMGMNHLDLKV